MIRDGLIYMRARGVGEAIESEITTRRSTRGDRVRDSGHEIKGRQNTWWGTRQNQVERKEKEKQAVTVQEPYDGNN